MKKEKIIVRRTVKRGYPHRRQIVFRMDDRVRVLRKTGRTIVCRKIARVVLRAAIEMTETIEMTEEIGDVSKMKMEVPDIRAAVRIHAVETRDAHRMEIREVASRRMTVILTETGIIVTETDAADRVVHRADRADAEMIVIRFLHQW